MPPFRYVELAGWGGGGLAWKDGEGIQNTPQKRSCVLAGPWLATEFQGVLSAAAREGCKKRLPVLDHAGYRSEAWAATSM